MSLDKHLTQKTYFGGLWALMRNYFLIFLIAYVSITVDNLFFYLGSIWFIGILQFAVRNKNKHVLTIAIIKYAPLTISK